MKPSTKAVLVRQQGFTVLEVIVALTVMVTLIGLAATFFNRYNDSLINKQVTEQLEQLGDAASAYVQDNYQVLVEKAKSAGTKNLIMGYLVVDLKSEQLMLYLANRIVPDSQGHFQNALGQGYLISIVAYAKEDEKTGQLIHLTIQPVIYGSTQLVNHKLIDINRFLRKIVQQIGVGAMYADSPDGLSNPTYRYKPIWWNGFGKVDDSSPAIVAMKMYLGAFSIGDLLYIPFMHNPDKAPFIPDSELFNKASEKYKWEPINYNQYTYNIIRQKMVAGHGAVIWTYNDGDNNPKMVLVKFSVANNTSPEVDNCFIDVNAIFSVSDDPAIARGYGINYHDHGQNRDEAQCLATTSFLALPGMSYSFTSSGRVNAEVTLFVPTINPFEIQGN